MSTQSKIEMLHKLHAASEMGPNEAKNSIDRLRTVFIQRKVIANELLSGELGDKTREELENTFKHINDIIKKHLSL